MYTTPTFLPNASPKVCHDSSSFISSSSPSSPFLPCRQTLWSEISVPGGRVTRLILPWAWSSRATQQSISTGFIAAILATIDWRVRSPRDSSSRPFRPPTRNEYGDSTHRRRLLGKKQHLPGHNLSCSTTCCVLSSSRSDKRTRSAARQSISPLLPDIHFWSSTGVDRKLDRMEGLVLSPETTVGWHHPMQPMNQFAVLVPRRVMFHRGSLCGFTR
jgi:hypothetical protein